MLHLPSSLLLFLILVKEKKRREMRLEEFLKIKLYIYVIKFKLFLHMLSSSSTFSLSHPFLVVILNWREGLFMLWCSEREWEGIEEKEKWLLIYTNATYPYQFPYALLFCHLSNESCQEIIHLIFIGEKN